MLRNSLLFGGSTPSEVRGWGGYGVMERYLNETNYLNYSSLWYKNNGEAVLPLPFHPQNSIKVAVQRLSRKRILCPDEFLNLTLSK